MRADNGIDTTISEDRSSDIQLWLDAQPVRQSRPRLSENKGKYSVEHNDTDIPTIVKRQGLVAISSSTTNTPHAKRTKQQSVVLDADQDMFATTRTPQMANPASVLQLDIDTTPGPNTRSRSRTKKSEQQPVALNEQLDIDATPKSNPLTRPYYFNATSTISNSSYGSSPCSGRSCSPAKSLRDLSLYDNPINIINFDTPNYPLPEGAKNLCHEMRSIERGRKVIPSALRSRLRRYEEQGMTDKTSYTDNGDEVTQGQGTINKEDEDDDQNYTFACDRDILTIHSDVRDILLMAAECDNSHLSEPSWNEVHSSLLRLALRGRWGKAKGIWYCNITTAQIDDSTLLPTIGGDTVSKKRMVDYAIIIEGSSRTDENLQKLVVDKLRRERAWSINQSAALGIQFKPIAVSIEAERGLIGEDDAQVQLSIWVSAQFTLLKRLTTNETANLPVLPLVFLQGHVWRLMIAATDEEGRITIWKYITLGSTNNVPGIYGIIAAIRRLARWVDEEYRPWFEKEVLDPHGV